MIKTIIKETARYLLYFLKRKRYKLQLLDDCVSLSLIRLHSQKEYFYGYYDHSPEQKGRLLFQEMQPDDKSVKIIVKDSIGERVIAQTYACNWQMGARAIWIDDDIVSYNDFDGHKYICKWYSLSQNKIVKIFDKPLQDYKGGKYFLGVNYQRLQSYAKEYAYYCLPKLSEKEYVNYDNDGIWQVDVESGKVELILSIADLIKIDYINRFDTGQHFVNHIMMSPNGESFIFIHRYYVNGVRYDRLMYSDYKSVKVLMDEPKQSHYCWLDNDNVFGYGDYKGKSCFNTVNVNTKEIFTHIELNKVHPRDGHPTVVGDWISIDDYPDLSRMQLLILYNYKTKEIKKVGEFFHDLKHKDFNRCDLHPRFSEDGKRIYIDTIYSGRRELVFLDVNL